MQVLQIIWNVNPEIFKIGGFSLRYYSLLFAVAFALGYYLMKKMYESERLDQEHLTPLLFYIIFGTIIGARLGQVFFYEFAYFKDHPLEIFLPFRFGKNSFEWTGFQGLASHGGAIGIAIAMALFCRKYKQDYLQALDKLVITVALAGFFIRVGNLFNSEILGEPTAVPWAFVFLRIDNVPRHPAQLYEALAYIAVFSILWILYKNKGHQLKRGYLFGFFLLLTFSARLLIEFVKENQKSFEAGWLLNMGQILSLPFVLLGLYYILRKEKQQGESIDSPKMSA